MSAVTPLARTGAAIFGCLAALALAATATAAGRTLVIGSVTVADAEIFAGMEAFNAGAGCLRAGDRVLLEEGRTFVGMLRLQACSGAPGGSADQAIEVRSFAPGAPFEPKAVKVRARIEGGTMAAALGLQWQRDDVARPDMPALAAGEARYRMGPLKVAPVELFIAGERWLLARSPDAPPPGGRAYHTAAQIADASGGCNTAVCLKVTDPAAQGAMRRLTTMAGTDTAAAGQRGYAVVRSSAWSLAASPVEAVAAADALELRLGRPVSGAGMSTATLPRNRSGFLLVGSPAWLDRSGEWLFDAEQRMLYAVAPAGTAPLAERTMLVTASARGRDDTPGIAFNGAQGKVALRLTQLSVAHSAGHGVRIEGAARVVVADIEVEQPGLSGIAIIDTQDAADVSRVTVTHAPDNGVLLRGGRKFALRDSRIADTGRIANQARFAMDMNGVRADGFEQIEITGNRFENAGYAGVMLGESAAGTAADAQMRLRVSDNRITGFCLLLNDCGAIYVNGRAKDGPAPPTAVKRIENNQISGGLGNLDGLPGPAQAITDQERKNGAYVRFVAAVYLDHRASGYDVRGNRVRGVYGPYTWRISNGGLLNACSRDETSRCKAIGKGYACYTPALDACNVVAAER